jgi:CxxC motif-containing protein (DUF1111 family)
VRVSLGRIGAGLRVVPVICLSLMSVPSLSAPALSSDAAVGNATASERRAAPLYRLPADAEPAQIDLGRSLFNTQWSAAGAPGAGRSGIARREGLGPLFNATSCNTCHSGGAAGSGPSGNGPIPTALEIQLESPAAEAGGRPGGDPVYGSVFSTSALEGVQAEGTVTVRYTEVYGYYYPDGSRWRMRVPHYRLDGLSHGTLASTTVIKPRLAPPLFGVGLLELVPETAVGAGGPGRFGWQGAALSVRDQTTKALAGEMGVTSPDRPSDDCTPAEVDCLRKHNGRSPAISAEEIVALVAFERSLAAPESQANTERDLLGSELFRNIGCAACHRLRMPVALPQADGTTVQRVIAPYTDLRLHDLGRPMDDETVAGVKVRSRWRTAPLWGSSYRMKAQGYPTFLHDGRARSPEEAILWHGGEAASARLKFVNLGPRSRNAVLHWLETR